MPCAWFPPATPDSNPRLIDYQLEPHLQLSVAAHRFHPGTKENEKANGAKCIYPPGRVTSLDICRQLRSAPKFDLPLPRREQRSLAPSPSPKTRPNPTHPNVNARRYERGRMWFDHEHAYAYMPACPHGADSAGGVRDRGPYTTPLGR